MLETHGTGLPEQPNKQEEQEGKEMVQEELTTASGENKQEDKPEALQETVAESNLPVVDPQEETSLDDTKAATESKEMEQSTETTLPEEPVEEPKVSVVEEGPEMLPLEEKGADEQTELPAIETPQETSGSIASAEKLSTGEKQDTEEGKSAPATEEQVASPSSEKEEKLTKEEMVAKLKAITEGAVENVKEEVDVLKRNFYKLHKAEVEEQKKQFIENGGEEVAFTPAEDKTEEKFKELLNVFRDKRSVYLESQEKTKEENLKKKEALIEKVKNLVESSEDINKAYNEFKKIQQEWNEITLIPQAKVNEIWRSYQVQVEKFYDLVKINNEFRDYDFKKNLEAKTILCEAAERLNEETDIISAFYQLQNLHAQWRETGPVAREKREEIWNRFKEASTVINKKHQQHFESLRENENKNLEDKTAICETIEAIDTSHLKTFKEWNEKTQEVIELQAKWKTIGFAPKKVNEKIFKRFRTACDKFFQEKSEFFKNLKNELNENYEKKKILADKAESLKDSTDWKTTSDELIALQKEWKTIGAVPKKYSEALWKRFIGACDYFFEQKNLHSSSQRVQENENLAHKKEIIEKIRNLDQTLDNEEALKELRALAKEFSEAGHVPFKEKDRIYKEYHEELDKQFDRLNVDQVNRKLTSYKESLRNISDNGKGKLYRERDKLYKTYEILKNGIQIYENNIGFLSASSKNAGTLIAEMERKIEKLKDDLELITKKIEAVDENMKQQE